MHQHPDFQHEVGVRPLDREVVDQLRLGFDQRAGGEGCKFRLNQLNYFTMTGEPKVRHNLLLLIGR
jgi:hypothetical protein